MGKKIIIQIIVGLVIGILFAMAKRNYETVKIVSESCERQGGIFVGHFFSDDVCYIGIDN